MWDSKKETNEYELWKATHNCSINHIKSLSSMERAGVINIFNRSVEKNSIIYHEYLVMVILPLSRKLKIFSWKWPVLAAKCHTRQKIIHNSVKTYDILIK